MKFDLSMTSPSQQPRNNKMSQRERHKMMMMMMPNTIVQQPNPTHNTHNSDELHAMTSHHGIQHNHSSIIALDHQPSISHYSHHSPSHHSYCANSGVLTGVLSGSLLSSVSASLEHVALGYGGNRSSSSDTATNHGHRGESDDSLVAQPAMADFSLFGGVALPTLNTPALTATATPAVLTATATPAAAVLALPPPPSPDEVVLRLPRPAVPHHHTPPTLSTTPATSCAMDPSAELPIIALSHADFDSVVNSSGDRSGIHSNHFTATFPTCTTLFDTSPVKSSSAAHPHEEMQQHSSPLSCGVVPFQLQAVIPTTSGEVSSPPHPSPPHPSSAPSQSANVAHQLFGSLVPTFATSLSVPLQSTPSPTTSVPHRSTTASPQHYATASPVHWNTTHNGNDYATTFTTHNNSYHNNNINTTTTTTTNNTTHCSVNTQPNATDLALIATAQRTVPAAPPSASSFYTGCGAVGSSSSHPTRKVDLLVRVRIKFTEAVYRADFPVQLGSFVVVENNTHHHHSGGAGSGGA